MNHSGGRRPASWQIFSRRVVIAAVIWLEMAHTNPTRVFWWEPRWSFVPRELREFRSSLRLGSWLRIVAVSAVVTIAIALVANATIPGLQFPWTAAFAVSIAAMVVILFMVMVLLAAVPPLVFITPKGFGWWWPPMLHHGFVYFKRSDLKSVTLTVRDDGMHYVRFRTNRFCKRVGVGRRVRLDRLLEMFGDSLIVRDRRLHRPPRSLTNGSTPMETCAK